MEELEFDYELEMFEEELLAIDELLNQYDL
jgi:hypothetical protein